MRTIGRILALFSFFVALVPSALMAADWKDALEEKLLSDYELTKTSKLSKEQVTSPGTVLVARIDGLNSGMPTRIIDGKLKPAGGLVQAMLPKEEKHDFKASDRFYVTDIKVGDDNIKFVLLSSDPSDVSRAGTTIQKHWFVALQFEYPKNYLRTADLAKLKADINAIISTEAQAKAVQTKTIEIGQTINEVEAILGKPETIAKLGAKTLYGYKGIKVTFVDGKVVDAQ